MAWTVHLGEDRKVSLDEFTFEDHWPAICTASSLGWLEVYAQPVTNLHAAAEVYRQAHRVAGLTAPAEITAPMIVNSFRFEDDAAPLAPSGGEGSASGSDGPL